MKKILILTVGIILVSGCSQKCTKEPDFVTTSFITYGRMTGNIVDSSSNEVIKWHIMDGKLYECDSLGNHIFYPNTRKEGDEIISETEFAIVHFIK